MSRMSYTHRTVGSNFLVKMSFLKKIRIKYEIKKREKINLYLMKLLYE